MCGCTYETAALYTKDLRGSKPRKKPVSRELSDSIYCDLVKGIPPKEIAEKNGVEITVVYGINKRVKRDLNDAAYNPEPKTPQEHSEPEPVAENAMCEIVANPPNSIGIFRNFTANFEGKYARYSVRDNKNLRVMIGESYCEIRLDDLKGIAGELIEVSKIFA